NWLLRHDRRCVGMDVERFPRLSGVRELSVQGVLRRILRSRLQSAAGRILGHSSRRDPKYLSQLGLSDPATDLQRLPLRARRMSNDRPSDVVGGTPPYTVRRSRQQMVRDVRQGLTKKPK